MISDIGSFLKSNTLFYKSTFVVLCALKTGFDVLPQIVTKLI
jgi:hypothetical protein